MLKILSATLERRRTLLKLNAQLTYKYKQNENQYYKHTL